MSFTVRNGDALAYRPGTRGDFVSALAAFGADAHRSDLGAAAHAHTREQVEHWCSRADLTIDAWYGVRVLTDARPPSAEPDDVDLPNCLAAEVEAGRRDPYRHVGSMLHFIAARR
jgi:S-adenosylmethionine-dependent methyltransferase